MTQWYRIGTCSVASGSKTVTFSTGVTLNLSVKPGDALLIGTGTNQPVEIGSITDNTHCELVENWPYASATSSVYAIIPGPNWDDRTALALDVATYLAAVSGVTQSSTTLTIGMGSQTLQIPHSTRLSPGAFVTISDTAAPTTRYMAGTVTAYIGAALTVNVTTSAGSGSGSSWNVNVGGSPGATGSTGPTGPVGSTGPAAWSAVAAWAASTAYVVGPPASVVTYLGETYVCTTAHTSTGSFDASKFSKVAAKGADAAGLTDGDKGDIVVSGSGTTFSIDSGVLSSFGRTLIDDADAATARATLGAGTGNGDVTAAAAFGTDNRLIRSDGTGKGVQSSGITVSDANLMTVPGLIQTAAEGGGLIVDAEFYSRFGFIKQSGYNPEFRFLGVPFAMRAVYSGTILAPSSSDIAFWLSANAEAAVGQASITSGFRFEVNGAIRCTSLTQTSDMEKKNKVGDSPGIEFIRALAPGCMMFTWKDHPAILDDKGDVVRSEIVGGSRTHLGVSAQATKAAADICGFDFGGYKDTAIAEPDKPSEKLVDYSQFIPPLIVSTADVDARLSAALLRIEALEAEVATLKSAS